ncbi:MAG: hypothetical protein BWY47_00600 [Bacteroidetes bacterium ADurb.Bin302]|nr:MAG: hypothetical protein BWY47_00600 [Bacteroidetes bacterium ADurb.Bin302]
MVRNRRNTLKLLIIVLALIIIFPLSISATSDLEQLTPINESTIDDGNIVIADEVYQKQQSESFDQGMFTLFTPTAEEILSTQIIKKNDQEVTQHHRVLDVTTNNNGYAKIGNELIEFAVSQEGRFSVGTTGGNPDNANDNNSKMLYGHPSPGTSYTTIRLDSNNYIYEHHKNYVKSW